jgi:hypothetical protein
MDSRFCVRFFFLQTEREFVFLLDDAPMKWVKCYLGV